MLRKSSIVLQSKDSFDTRSFSSPALDPEMVRSSRDVEELFAAIDTDGNGVIDKTEFTDAMQRVGLEQLDGLRQSLSRNELSRTRPVTFDKEGSRIPTSLQYTDEELVCESAFQEITWAQTFAHRFQVTAEVIVSKIFPAGFAWQGASVLAENWGMSGDSLSFALTTGVGDGIGVLTGHTLFMMGKKAVTGNNSIDIGTIH